MSQLPNQFAHRTSAPGPLGRIGKSAYFRWMIVAASAMALVRICMGQDARLQARIASGSMAPYLLGPNYAVRCGACGISWNCDCVTTSLDREVTCPNCGASTRVSPDMAREGDVVRIDRTAYAILGPERFDIVAFRRPNDPTRMIVKRVIGLPGETISFQDGEVLVDAAPQPKDPSTRRMMALLVHDDEFQPQASDNTFFRWLPAKDKTKWVSAHDGYRRDGADIPVRDGSSEIDWLIFDVNRSHRDPQSNTAAGPLYDDDPFVPHISRSRDLAHELRLTGKVAWSGQGILAWFLSAEEECDIEVRLRLPEGSVEVYVAGNRVSEYQLPYDIITTTSNGHDFEVTNFDGQLELNLNGRSLVRHALGSAAPSNDRVTAPKGLCGIGGAGLILTVSDLRVYRDIVYQGPTDVQESVSTSAEIRLERDEYYVLGDNAVLSDDFAAGVRGPVITHNMLVGRVSKSETDSPPLTAKSYSQNLVKMRPVAAN